jgi:lysophospholipase L1-like esterase
MILHKRYLRKHKIFSLEVPIQNDGEFHHIKIVFPSWSNPILKDLVFNKDTAIDSSYQLNKGYYYAIGDSITHGVGQDSASHLTYPFLLSQKLDLTLHNFAVGGGKVSQPVAALLKECPPAEIITILIGYNDWSGSGKKPEVFQKDLTQFLKTALANQPNAEFWIMRPLFTKTQKSKKSGLPIDEFRNAIDRVLADINDPRCHLVESDKFTDASYLRPDNPKDPVHLGKDGARMLAEHLYNRILKK